VSLFEVTLSDGRNIWANTLHVAATYAHMYEGTPDWQTNLSYLNKFPARIERIFHGPWPVHVIDPEQWIDASAPLTINRLPVQYLPPVWCAAEFMGPGLTCLVVVWFQETGAPVPDPAALEALRALDWTRHARDFTP
jgi:hypothetical protein